MRSCRACRNNAKSNGQEHSVSGICSNTADLTYMRTSIVVRTARTNHADVPLPLFLAIVLVHLLTLTLLVRLPTSQPGRSPRFPLSPRLRKLKILIASHNNIGSLPAAIGQLDTLVKCVSGGRFRGSLESRTAVGSRREVCFSLNSRRTPLEVAVEQRDVKQPP